MKLEREKVSSPYMPSVLFFVYRILLSKLDAIDIVCETINSGQMDGRASIDSASLAKSEIMNVKPHCDKWPDERKSSKNMKRYRIRKYEE